MLSKMDIQDLAAFTSTYSKGTQYLRQGNIISYSSEYDAFNELEKVQAVVKGSNGKKYFVSMDIDDAEGTIFNEECSCPAFEQYEGLCKHLVAAALAYVAHEKSNKKMAMPPQQKKPVTTDPAAISLIRQYAHKSICQARAAHTEILARIEPVLEFGYDDGLTVSFKIGVDRMYVIKDLSEFCMNMQNQAETTYGKNLTFLHDIRNFDDHSKKIAEFIMAYQNQSQSYSYYRYYSQNKKVLELNTFALDEFFRMCVENEIQCKVRNNTLTAFVRRENPRLTIRLVKNQAGLFELELTDQINLFEGAKNLFVVMENTIYVCTPDYAETSGNLLHALYSRSEPLLIRAEDMPALSSSVLTKVKPYFHMDTNADISTFEPEKLVSKLYLDMPSNDTITAKLEFHYGSLHHDAFHPKDVSESFDIEKEVQAEDLILKYFPQLDMSKGYALAQSEEEIYAIVDEGLAKFSEGMEVYATDKVKNIEVRPSTAVSVGVRVEGDLLRLAFDIEDFDLSELTAVLHSYKLQKKYHRLKDGTFINLENSSLADFSALADGLDLSDKDILKGKLSVPKYRALYLDNLIKQSETLKYDRDSHFKKIVRDIKDVSDSDFVVPKPLKHTLRSYQKTGFRWMKTIGAYGFGGILADDMGLGKTLQVITLLMSQKESSKTHSLSIVICPSSLVLNWESEIKKFAPDLKAQTVLGTTAERKAVLGDAEQVDLLITSYDLLKRDVEQYENLRFTYEIIDEAQYIKNHNTQNAKSVKMLDSQMRLALTGTPIENSLAELWSIYDYLMPGYLYNYHKFKTKYETPIVRSKDKGALSQLKKLVSPFILRRLKKDVLKELPEKTETVLYAGMEDEQKKLYVANAASVKQELAKQLGMGNMNNKLQVLAMLTRLRQICCDPSLLYKDYQGGSSKLNMCVELIENCVEAGHKLLLFSQFTSMLQIIEDKLKEKSIPFYKITGSTKSGERLELVNAFNADDIPVFLISLKAGGVGLNLTGADVVIHYDPWWNLSAQNQATDRSHRIGQKNSVQVYKLIAKDTIEERILEMQASKSKLAEMIIKDGDGAISHMSKEDILKLFD